MPPNVINPSYGEYLTQQPLEVESPATHSDISAVIGITLTSINAPIDVRTLELKAGEPCLIGRASKTTGKNLHAHRTNALYDCPVISREHAEIRGRVWESQDNSVQIVDKGSMHGTRVNGSRLAKDKPMPLRSGDIIQLGERVTRGDSMFDTLNKILASTNADYPGNHDGVRLIFRRSEMPETHVVAQRGAPSNPRTGYRLRYSSDEGSDYASDGSNASDGEDVAEVSSAKTTPEHAHSKLGSQSQPIDLGRAGATAERQSHSSSNVQYDAIVIPESIPLAHPKNPVTLIEDDSDDDEVEFVGSSVRHGIPPLRASAQVFPAMEATVDDETDDEADNADYPHNGETENLDSLAGSPPSDSQHYSDEEQMDDDEDQLEEEDELDQEQVPNPPLPPRKEASPELATSGPSQNASGLRSAYHLPQLSSTLPQPSNNPYLLARPPPPQPPQPPSWGASHDFYRPTRWDQAPTFGSAFPHSQSYFPVTSVNEPTPFANVDHNAPPFGFSQGWDDSDGFPCSPVKNTYGTRATRWAAASSTSKDRISIPNIVENKGSDEASRSQDYAPTANLIACTMGNRATPPPKGAAPPISFSHSYYDTAPFDGPDDFPVFGVGSVAVPFDRSGYTPPPQVERSAASPTLTSRKRKADDLTSDPSNVVPQPPVFDEEFNLALAGLARPQVKTATSEPARKKAKTTSAASNAATVSSVAGSIAKYAAVATAGGAATLAFLCSPASEQLVSWLA